MCHEVKIGYFLTFKILRRNVYRVTLFDVDGSEIIRKCDTHPMNFKLKEPVKEYM